MNRRSSHNGGKHDDVLTTVAESIGTAVGTVAATVEGAGEVASGVVRKIPPLISRATRSKPARATRRVVRTATRRSVTGMKKIARRTKRTEVARKARSLGSTTQKAAHRARKPRAAR